MTTERGIPTLPRDKAFVRLFGGGGDERNAKEWIDWLKKQENGDIALGHLTALAAAGCDPGMLTALLMEVHRTLYLKRLTSREAAKLGSTFAKAAAGFKVLADSTLAYHLGLGGPSKALTIPAHRMHGELLRLQQTWRSSAKRASERKENVAFAHCCCLLLRYIKKMTGRYRDEDVDEVVAVITGPTFDSREFRRRHSRELNALRHLGHLRDLAEQQRLLMEDE